MGDDMKAALKKTLSRYFKTISITVIIIAAIVVLLASSSYIIRMDESKKTKLTNNEYAKTVKVDPQKGIYSTLEEENDNDNAGENNPDESGSDDNNNESEEKYDDPILQFFADNGYELEKYFDEPDSEQNEKNFKKILNAELVTQFPYIESLSPDKVNGVIRFKRINTDDESQTDYLDNETDISASLQDCLIYATNNEFYNWISEYNADNSKTASKENAMGSFTIIGENNEIVEVAVLKEARVITNDELYKVKEDTDPNYIKDIRSGLDETFQNASYTVSIDPETGDTVYTFQVLSTIKIEYKQFIEKYTMPSDFLFNLLTYSKDLDFVLSVADLAYQSTIVIGIYDANSSIVTYSKEFDYNRQEKQETTIETYVPRVLGTYGGFSEDNEVSGTFEAFGSSVLAQYPTEDDVNTSQEYGSFFNVESKNEYDTNGYNDTITHLYEYLIDENGNPAINTEPKDYYLDYYFYEDIPQFDLHIADIWYGYYSRHYYYNEPEMTVTVNDPIVLTGDVNYAQINIDSGRDYSLESDIIGRFSVLVDAYVESGAFYREFSRSFYYPPFKYDGPEITENMTEEEKKQIEEDMKKQEAEYDKAYDEAWDEHMEECEEEKKEELKSRLSETSVVKSESESVRDNNIIQTISTNTLSAEQKFYYTELAAENFHFSKILQNHAKAFNALDDIGGWLIEALGETESTKNVVEKVKYLLNQAYDTNSFGEITADELTSLYTTNSVNVNIPTNGNFLATAKACHDYLRLNNYYYSSAANIEAGNFVQDGTSQGRIVPIELGEPQNERYIDCSAYVTWVLMQTGHIDPEPKWQYTSYVLYANNADGLGFESMAVSGVEDLTDEDLSANGYIIVKNGHTEIYAGKDADGYYYTYNAGSTSSIRKEKSKYTKEQFYSHFNSDYKILIVGEV